jgi:prevent-host-death family protein
VLHSACVLYGDPRMSKSISLREANQAFARCVRDVEAGEEYVITRNGRPVARLVPFGGRRVLSPEQQAARVRARSRMEKGWPIGAGPLDRESLHER